MARKVDAPAQKKRIFIAEDDDDIRLTLSVILENAGYEVESSKTGRFILECRYAPPDLFILDRRVPDIDGLDICRMLRQIAEYQKTPVIIISASPKIGPLALAAGANDFLEKPFEIHRLLTIIRKYA